MDLRIPLLTGAALLAAAGLLWKLWPEGAENSGVLPTPQQRAAETPMTDGVAPRGDRDDVSTTSRRATTPTPEPTGDPTPHASARPSRARLADVLAEPETRPRELLAALVAAIAEQEVALGRGMPWTAGEPIQPLLHTTDSSFLAVHSSSGTVHTVSVHENHYPAVFALLRALDETPLLGPLDKDSEHHRSASAVLADLQQP